MSGLEALGVACNIMQLLEVAGGIISGCKALHDGKATSMESLQGNANSMMGASSKIQEDAASISKTSNPRLLKVAQECVRLSSELERVIGDISLSTAKGSWRKSLSASYKARRNKTKIEEIGKSLERCAGTMVVHVLVDQNMRDLARDAVQSSQFHELSQDVQQLATRCVDSLASVSRQIDSQHEQTRAHSATVASQTVAEVNSHVTNEFGQLVASKSLEEAQTQLRQFLKSIDFNLRNQRFSTVSVAHEETWTRVCSPRPPNSIEARQIPLEDLERIDNVWEGFLTWLRSKETNKPFWISGKPGSGKSTLVKFLVQHRETRKVLDAWGANALIVHHFFWKVGGGMQSNLFGLLCSLIYQLVVDEKELMPQLLTQLETVKFKQFHADWSIEELEEALFATLKIHSQPVCFFIDGLDEVSDGGEVRRLLGLVSTLATSKNAKVKICISSRPEPRFEASFRDSPRLEVHEVTQIDMKEYVESTLDGSSLTDEVCGEFKRHIVKTLLDKASGVFLWLTLALQSLLDGLENGDDNDVLLQRLELLPDKLETLYSDMWCRLNESKVLYRQEAAKYFNQVLSWNEHLETSNLHKDVHFDHGLLSVDGSNCQRQRSAG